MIKAVIFDLDGVICSTDNLHYIAWSKLADKENIYFDEKINARLKGVSRMDSLNIILEKASKIYSDKEKEQLAEYKNEIYKQLLHNLTKNNLSGDVSSTLDFLKRDGYKIAIGSSSKNTHLILKRLEIEDIFDVIVDGNDITNSKPNPEVFLKAATKLNLNPNECIVVEDAVSGIDAAHAGGFLSAGIKDARNNLNVDYKLNKFADILFVLDIEKIKSTHMYNEIHEQIDILKTVYDENINKIKNIVEQIKKRKITNVILSARGSSDNACVYFKYLCEIYAGLPCGFAAPSVSTLYEGKLKYENTLVIGVSQSGAGLDILNVIKEAKRVNAMTISITNFKDSPLATAADYHLWLKCGEEKSVAATKTFISEMYILGLLCAELASSQHLKNNLDKVSSLLFDTLKSEKDIFLLAKRCVSFCDSYMLSRGINYVSSLESALKLQETTYIKSKAYSISDFYHGPFAVVDGTQNIFLLHGKGKTDKDVYDIFTKLLENHANVIVVSNDLYFKSYEKAYFIPECDECISPFAIIATMQLFSCALSIIKGINPDCPRGLKKVTITK